MDILPLLLFFICQLVNLTKLWSTLTSFLFESLLFTEKNLGNLASPVPTAHPLTTVPAHCYTQRIRLLYRHLLLSGPKYCFLRFASKAVTQGFPSRSAPSLNNLHVLSKQGPLALTSFSPEAAFSFPYTLATICLCLFHLCPRNPRRCREFYSSLSVRKHLL